MITGNVEAITVDKNHIQIQGTCGSDTPARITLYLFEFKAYEVVTALDDRAPVATTFLQLDQHTDFTLSIPRFEEGRDRLYSRFMVQWHWPDNSADTEFLPGVCYVTDMRGISAYDYPYPQAHTIKGLQVRDATDAIHLGIGHAALNLNQPTIMRPSAGKSTITYTMDGQDFYFDEAYLFQFDRQVKELSDNNVIVYLILLNSRQWDNITVDPTMETTLLHPDYDPEGFISAFNVVTEDGFAHYKAFVEFVADRYSRPDNKYGRVSGYIIGNEVDAQWIWCNAGEKTVEDYMQEYALAVRTAFYAARKQYSRARVYISLTHHWTMPHTQNPLHTYRARDIVEIMNRMSVSKGNFDWSIAYHPYPEDLMIASFWDNENASDSFDTPLITFKNIEILPTYLSQSHLLYDERMRHLILSEQGLNSLETDESERIQAAAYALAYWKIERTKVIEAFIYHAHVDHRDEFDLNLGIRRRDKASDSPNAPGEPKPVYAIFKDIDSPKQADILEAAKVVIGETTWQDVT